MKRLLRFYPILALLCAFFFSSCDLFNGTQSNANQVNTQTASTPVVPTPTPIPPVSTNCPADGTARAAIMPPLPASSHQGVLYVTRSSNSDSNNFTNILSRYDVTTGQKTDLLTATVPIHLGGAISEERLSNNGQWIAFVTVVEGKQAVQLMRADGRELQTLYCAASGNNLGNNFPNPLSFSPDTKYLTFQEVSGDSIQAPTNGPKKLMLLELATSKLSTLEKIDQTWSAVYEPIKWRDNTSLYATYTAIGLAHARDRQKVYLIPDVTQNSTLQQISLPQIADGSGDMAYDFDFSPDNTQVLASDCQSHAGVGPDSYTSPCTIEITPSTGGTPHVIHTSQHIIAYARFITNATIWFDVDDSPDTGSNGLWKMNVDGSGLTRLSTVGASFENLSYSSSMHRSPDNTMFAIQGNSISIGSMNGGNTTTVASSAELVGWTAY